MKYRAILERHAETSALRTQFAVGYAELPVVGRGFKLIAKGLTPGLPFRLVQTSPLVDIMERQDPNCRIFEITTESGALYTISIEATPIDESQIDDLLMYLSEQFEIKQTKNSYFLPYRKDFWSWLHFVEGQKCGTSFKIEVPKSGHTLRRWSIQLRNCLATKKLR
jgi:hypothetical protein